MNLNKESLASEIAAKAELTKAQATAAITAFTDTVTEVVADGGKVTLVGFATFERVEKAAREGRNPKTGETIQIPARKAPKITAGKTFKQACN
jgi:DNA-binding protein HU-beta